jgi:hypothetical protein
LWIEVGDGERRIEEQQRKEQRKGTKQSGVEEREALEDSSSG